MQGERPPDPPARFGGRFHPGIVPPSSASQDACRHAPELGRVSHQVDAADATAGDLLSHRSTTKKAPAFYNDAVWEDETHVLLTVFQDGMWSMVRMDVQGAMEYAIAPQQGNQDNVPWRFETR